MNNRFRCFASFSSMQLQTFQLFLVSFYFLEKLFWITLVFPLQNECLCDIYLAKF